MCGLIGNWFMNTLPVTLLFYFILCGSVGWSILQGRQTGPNSILRVFIGVNSRMFFYPNRSPNYFILLCVASLGTDLWIIILFFYFILCGFIGNLFIKTCDLTGTQIYYFVLYVRKHLCFLPKPNNDLFYFIVCDVREAIQTLYLEPSFIGSHDKIPQIKYLEPSFFGFSVRRDTKKI